MVVVIATPSTTAWCIDATELAAVLSNPVQHCPLSVDGIPLPHVAVVPVARKQEGWRCFDITPDFFETFVDNAKTHYSRIHWRDVVPPVVHLKSVGSEGKSCTFCSSFISC